MSNYFKKFVCLLSCIFIIFASLSFCFASGYLPEYSSTPSIAEISSSPVYYIKNNITYYFAVNNSNSSVDYIYYYNTRNDAYEHLLISKNSFIQYKYYSTDSEVSVSNSNHQQSDNYYFLVAGNISGTNTGALDNDMFAFIPDVNNTPDAVAYAFSHTLEYPTNVIDMTGNGYLNQGIKAGNITYFEIGSGNTYSIDLISDFNEKSGIFSNNWVNDNRRYGFSDSLPTTSTQIGENTGTALAWVEYGNTDLLGRASKGAAHIEGTASAKYLWIVNPLYNSGYYDDSLKASSINGDITRVSGLAVNTPYYEYPLKQSATSLGLASDVATTVGGIGTVTNDGTNNSVVNDGTTNGGIYVQNPGGWTQPPETVSAVEGIRQTLDQFVQSITNLFTAPINHIQQLLSIGGSFLQNISGIWSWLPSPLDTMVVTGLSVILAIGILHTLL